MPTFLIQVSYNPDAWKAQMQSRADVRARAEPSATKLGGVIHALYYSLGAYDLIGIVEFPSPEAAAAWSIAITSGGAVTKFETTQLLTIDQGIEALGLAADAAGSYQSPIRSPGG
jgi:uncharacterized protein with GYD domain